MLRRSSRPAPRTSWLNKARAASFGMLALSGPWVYAQSAQASPTVQSDSDPAYWVFFTDKGPIAGYQAALQARAQELSAATLKRRAKVRSKDALVDARDLAVSADYRQQVKALARSEVRVQSRWLNAISLRLSASEKQAISNLPFVQKVEPVGLSQRLEAPPPRYEGPWAAPDPGPPRALDYGKTKAQLERMGIPAAHDCGLTGKGVTVGILDSGFRTNLKLFSNIEILGQYDFVKKDDNVSNQPGDPSGQDGHGSSCLGLMAGSIPGQYIGAAPDVKVLLAKTEDTGSEKPIEEDYYVAGLEWVESKGADIATSSLGYSQWIKAGEKDGKTAKVSIATNVAFENGMICLTSAGNSGPKAKTLSVPADGLHILSVGATSVSGKIASFSSRGPTDDGRMKPEFVCPGEQVWVVSTSGKYRKGNGTSFSAPMAAGGVALLLQMNPDLSPQEIRDLLQKTSRPNGKPNNSYGWGEMNIAKAVEEHCECVDADKDGFRDEKCGGKDCNDSDPEVNPDAKEICDDGIDNDCDDKIDDQDTDCDDPSESPKEDPSETDPSEEDTPKKDTPEESEKSKSNGEKTPSDDPSADKPDPEPPSGRCSAQASPSTSGLGAMTLGLLLWLRRRRSTTKA